MPTEENTAPLQVTDPSAWGSKTVVVDGDMVELPSGNTAKIRRTMSILRIVQEGSIPNPLRGIIMRMITSNTMNMPKGSDKDPKLMSQFGDFLDGIAVETMVDPPVDRPIPRGKLKNDAGEFINRDETEDEYYERLETWVPKEGHLSVFLLDVNDKMFLFVYAQGAAADAKSFRGFTADALEPLEDVKEPVAKTKRTGGAGKGSKAGK